MITPEQLIADPMYQLNLVLWLLQPLSDNYPLRPVLRQNGYVLDGISQRLPIVDPDLVSSLHAAKVPFSPRAEIDVLASRADRTEYLLLECKRSMVWVRQRHEEQTRQGTSFLLQAGRQLNTAMVLPLNTVTNSCLVYVSAFDTTAYGSVHDLSKLARDLAGRGFDVAPVGLMGLVVETETDGSKAIYLRDLCREEHSPLASCGTDDPARGVCIQRIEPDEDPRPLYYVPFDPTAFDGAEKTNPQSRENHDYCKRVFRDRLLQKLVCDIGSTTVPGEVILDPADYLRQALMGVYEKCKRGNLDRDLRRQFKVMMKEALASCKSACKVESLTSPPTALKVKVTTVADKENILDGLFRLGDEEAAMKTPDELDQLDPPDLFSYLEKQLSNRQTVDDSSANGSRKSP